MEWELGLEEPREVNKGEHLEGPCGLGHSGPGGRQVGLHGPGQL